jgi:transcriptional regulator with XRE-family HTH domain
MSPKKSVELLSQQTRKKFRERFREWRLKRGISQDELARKADVPSASVSHFERGMRFPNAETLRRLADALGVSADYLLGRVDDPAGEGLGGTDPEFAALFRKFQGMTEEAREEVKEFLDNIAAKDKKGGGRESKK